MTEFKVGDYVEHRLHGCGIVAGHRNQTPTRRITVHFEKGKTVHCAAYNLTLKEKPQMNKIAIVEFPSGLKDYHFRTDIELRKGDAVVVDTANGFVVAKVVKTIPESSRATKWVVQRIDVAAHELRLNQQVQVQRLKAELETRQKAVEKEAVHQLMCGIDPEYAKIYSTLKSLGEV